MAADPRFNKVTSEDRTSRLVVSANRSLECSSLFERLVSAALRPIGRSPVANDPHPPPREAENVDREALPTLTPESLGEVSANFDVRDGSGGRVYWPHRRDTPATAGARLRIGLPILGNVQRPEHGAVAGCLVTPQTVAAVEESQ